MGSVGPVLGHCVGDLGTRATFCNHPKRAMGRSLDARHPFRRMPGDRDATTMPGDGLRDRCEVVMASGETVDRTPAAEDSGAAPAAAPGAHRSRGRTILVN